MYYIYALVDPINNLPFYIGKGKNKRAMQHLRKCEKSNNKKVNYINNIRLLGSEPEIHYIMENIEDEKLAYSYEYYMIKNAHLFGLNLTNRIGIDLRPPSRLGSKMSEKSKEAISNYNKTRPYRPMSEEQKRLLSSIHRGKKKPERTLSHKTNIGKSKSKSYIITFPDGKIEIITNLRQFCEKYKLSQSKMCLVSNGKRNHHKDFKIIPKL